MRPVTSETMEQFMKLVDLELGKDADPAVKNDRVNVLLDDYRAGKLEIEDAIEMCKRSYTSEIVGKIKTMVDLVLGDDTDIAVRDKRTNELLSDYQHGKFDL